MTLNPQERLIYRLLAVFGSPKTDNPEAYLREFSRALSRYSADDLEIGGDRVIDSATFFPRPAEVIAAIREHHETKRVAPVESSNWNSLRYREPSDDSKARVDALVKAAAAKIITDGDGSKGQDIATAAQEPGFRAMQQRSPNTHLHTLTEVSRRMTGDHRE